MYTGRDWPFVAAGDSPILTMAFCADLADGESIISCIVTCEAMNGVDPAPSIRLAVAPQISGSSVLQAMSGVVGGESYRVTFVVATTERSALSRYSYLQAFAPGT